MFARIYPVAERSLNTRTLATRRRGMIAKVKQKPEFKAWMGKGNSHCGAIGSFDPAIDVRMLVSLEDTPHLWTLVLGEAMLSGQQIGTSATERHGGVSHPRPSPVKFEDRYVL
jgi:hypothetical protein